MRKPRSPRNKTITLSDDEIEYYVSKCEVVTSPLTLPNITDKIIYGDTLQVMDYLPTACVDLLIVDPPYNIYKTFNNTTFKQMNGDDYSHFTEEWICKVKPLLKSTASIYVCCDWRSSMIIGSVLVKHFHIQNRITWQREKGRGAAHNWKNSLEDIWFATVSASEYIFNVDAVKMRRKVIAPYKVNGLPKDWIDSKDGRFRDTYPSNFWDDISIPYWSMPENTEHPTQKPEKLFAKLLLASSCADELVFDPFLGSGTTAVVAKKLGRRFVGIECEREYCALAMRRLEMASEGATIQGFTDGVFWERNTGRTQGLRRKE